MARRHQGGHLPGVLGQQSGQGRVHLLWLPAPGGQFDLQHHRTQIIGGNLQGLADRIGGPVQVARRQLHAPDRDEVAHIGAGKAPRFLQHGSGDGQVAHGHVSLGQCQLNGYILRKPARQGLGRCQGPIGLLCAKSRLTDDKPARGSLSWLAASALAQCASASAGRLARCSSTPS